MTRLLLCTATLLALTASANAQREFSSYFGMNSPPTAAPAPYFGSDQHPCTYTTTVRCPKIERPKVLRTTGKKGR
jgi:hypothetical protein